MNTLTSVAVGLLSLSTTASSLSLPNLHPRSIVPPSGCPLPTWEVTSFNWYNGSKSLDCIHDETDIASYGCFRGSSWLEPIDQATCNAAGGNWVGLCVTGLPSYQPWGYGPPQTLAFDFADGLTCADQYIGYRIKDIGNGESNCGYADRGLGRIVSFYGSSNVEGASTGRLDYVLGSGHALTCEDGRKITYSGSTEFELDCVHDAAFNATCTAEAFAVPVLSYEWVN
ncbi:hypothetical protein BJX70DRAFT_380194 [Aspergillus crustosus]